MYSNRLNNICSQVAASEVEQEPIRVCVTGAAGNIAYSLLFQIGAGRMLGSRKIELRLLDIPPMASKIRGVKMELDDCAFPTLTKIIPTTDYKVAFTKCDLAILVGAKPRGPGMVRADLLKANAKIFAGQGRALNEYASRNVKVVVVGNPANTNALITSVNAPDIPAENITALTRLDMNRAISQLSTKTGVPVEDIQNVIIWGNHSKTQYPDINHGIVRDGDRYLPLLSVVSDSKWVSKTFISTVQTRGAAIIKARKLSSAASAANAVVDHVRDWFLGTAPGVFVSMAVPSDGSYGIPKGIVYSFPVTCSPGGSYKIVQGLKINKFSREKMQLTAKELLSEREQALQI